MRKIILFLAAIVIFSLSSKEQLPYMVKDIFPGEGHGRPIHIYDFNDLLFFQADDGLHGEELWISDATEEGTVMVKDIWEGPSGSNPYDFEAFDGKLFFNAWDSIHHTQLWVTDGTEAGTYLFKDIEPGGYGQPYDLTAYEGSMYFCASDSNGTEPWISDGTEAGTVLLKDIAPEPYSAEPHGFFGVNGLIYFCANDIEHGRELWVTDGTSEGTYLVKDIYPGAHESIQNTNHFISYNDKVYFTASDGVNNHGRELWVSDGSPEGTYLVKDIYPGNHSAFEIASSFCVYNGLLYFMANDGVHGNEMWVTDGTAEGTVFFFDFMPGGVSGYPLGFHVYNDKMYFSAFDENLWSELFVSDGTVEGTTMVKDINPGSESSAPTRFFTYNGLLYFQADDGTNGKELWLTDGTSEGTHKVEPDLVELPDPLDWVYFYGFAISNDVLYYTARYTNLGMELYAIGNITQLNERPEIISDLHVYPNPSLDHIYLDFFSTEAASLEICMYSMDGKLVVPIYESRCQTGNNSFKLSLPENLPSGLYLAEIKLNSHSQTLKFIKE